MLDKNIMAIHEFDEYYMKKALTWAIRAGARGEIPVGALVVNKQGEILAGAANMSRAQFSQSRHAEVRAIDRAGKKIKDWRLEGCTLYVTLEPCFMCMGLIGLSRIQRLVYGAESPLFGYHLDKEQLPCLYQKHMRGITSGVLADESKKLLEKFFKQMRKKGEQF